MNFSFGNVPPFANEAVCSKSRALDYARADLSKIDSSIFELQQRITLMQQHAGNVGNELAELQHVVCYSFSFHPYSKVNSRSVEYGSLKNDIALRYRHIGAVKSETRAIVHGLNLSEDLTLSLQEHILESRSKLRRLEDISRLKEAEVSSWGEAHRDRLADEQLMEEYTRVDSNKSKVLNAELRILVSNREDACEEVTKISSEKAASRVELESVLKEVRTCSEDTIVLLNQLEVITEKVRSADSDLLALSDRFIESSTGTHQKRNEVSSLRTELSRILESNRLKGNELNLGETDLSKLREEARSFSSVVNEFRTELDSRKAELRAALSEETRLHVLGDSLIKSVEIARVRLNGLEKKLESENSRQQAVYQGKLSKEREVDGARVVLEETVAGIAQVERQIKDEKDKLLVETVMYETLKQTERTTSTELRGLEAMLKHLPLKIDKLTNEKLKLTEGILGIEFDIESGKKELESLAGHVSSPEEREVLTRRQAELENQCKEIKAVLSLLIGQVKRQDSEMKRYRLLAQGVQQDQEEARARQVEVESEINLIERAIFECENLRTELLVSRDELTCAVSMKRDEFKVLVEDLLAAQSRHTEAVESSEKVSNEASARMIHLQNLNKQLHEQRHIVALSVGEGQQRFSQIQIRFDHLLRRRTGAGEDDIHNQANAVVRVAQKREDMVFQAEKLAKQLRNSMCEIKALETAGALWKGNIERFSPISSKNEIAGKGISEQELEMADLTLSAYHNSRRLEDQRSELDSEGITLIDLKSRCSLLEKKILEDENRLCQLLACAFICSACANAVSDKTTIGFTPEAAITVTEESLKDLTRSCHENGPLCPIFFQKLRPELLIKGIDLYSVFSACLALNLRSLP